MSPHLNQPTMAEQLQALLFEWDEADVSENWDTARPITTWVSQNRDALLAALQSTGDRTT